VYVGCWVNGGDVIEEPRSWFVVHRTAAPRSRPFRSPQQPPCEDGLAQCKLDFHDLILGEDFLASRGCGLSIIAGGHSRMLQGDPRRE
jgi:hypothetical protein